MLAGFLLLIVLALAAAYLLGDANSGEARGAPPQSPVRATRHLNLPSDFPQVEGMTYTNSQTSGPSEIADGYYEGDLQGGTRRGSRRSRAQRAT